MFYREPYQNPLKEGGTTSPQPSPKERECGGTSFYVITIVCVFEFLIKE